MRSIPSELDLIEAEGLLDALDIALDTHRRFDALEHGIAFSRVDSRQRDALQTAYEVAKNKIMSGDRAEEVLATLRRLIELARGGYLEGARYSAPPLEPAALSDQHGAKAARRTNPKDIS